MLRRPLATALFLFASFAGASRALPQASPAGAPGAGPKPLLPTDFAGWSLAHPPQQSTSPSAADSGNAPVLTEDGLTRFEAADYARGDGKLNLRAIQFQDASGAYAAYTFYRRPGTLQEDIGQGAANSGAHILFWQGTTVVDASFDHVSAMSASELRELAQMLPAASGSSGIAPPLPRYMPVEGIAPVKYEPLSTHYSLGPLGYSNSGGILPVSLVGFDRGAEVLTGAYTSPGGDGVLTLINYPTPQLAAERQRAIEAFLKTGNRASGAAQGSSSPALGTQGQGEPAPPWSQALSDSNPQSLLCRRSGPIVAVTSGSLSEVDARRLVGRVNYLAEVTWNDPKGYNSEVSKTAHILLGIAALSGILCGAALIIAIFLGGGRALYRKMRGKPVSTLNDAEFISLRLDD